MCKAPAKVRIFIATMPISSPNPMFDHLLESSHQENSNKWSNIGFGEEIGIVAIKIRTYLVPCTWEINGFFGK